MSHHDPNIRLRDMVHHAEVVLSKVRGITREQFDADQDLRTVVAWNLMVIGEAASRVDSETQAAMPQIPWPRITGMRNRLVHDYDGNINPDVVWATATENVSELIEEIRRYLGES